MKKEKNYRRVCIKPFSLGLFGALASAGFAEGTSVLRLIAIIPLVFGFLCLGQLLGGGGGRVAMVAADAVVVAADVEAANNRLLFPTHYSWSLVRGLFGVSKLGGPL